MSAQIIQFKKPCLDEEIAKEERLRAEYKDKEQIASQAHDEWFKQLEKVQKLKGAGRCFQSTRKEK